MAKDKNIIGFQLVTTSNESVVSKICRPKNEKIVSALQTDEELSDEQVKMIWNTYPIEVKEHFKKLFKN